MKIRAILVLLVLWMGSLAIAQEAEGFAVRGGVELSGEADVWISLYAIVDGVMQEEPLAQTVVQQDDTYRFEQEEEELRFAPGFYGLFASRDTQQIGNLQIFCIKGEDVTVDVTGPKAAEKCNNDCL